MSDAAALQPTASETPIGRKLSDQIWARWLARSFDSLWVLGLTYLLWLVLGGYGGLLIGMGRLPVDAFAWSENPWLAGAADVVTFVVIFVLIEPMLLAAWGTTPGKWVMGIRILREDGRPPGYFHALWRTIRVVALGCGLFIPILSVITMIASATVVNDKGRAPWDETVNSVRHAPRAILVWVFAIVAVFSVRLSLIGAQIAETNSGAG
jgi:uncharacterized RDD family membrane protein YckC